MIWSSFYLSAYGVQPPRQQGVRGRVRRRPVQLRRQARTRNRAERAAPGVLQPGAAGPERDSRSAGPAAPRRLRPGPSPARPDGQRAGHRAAIRFPPDPRGRVRRRLQGHRRAHRHARRSRRWTCAPGRVRVPDPHAVHAPAVEARDGGERAARDRLDDPAPPGGRRGPLRVWRRHHGPLLRDGRPEVLGGLLFARRAQRVRHVLRHQRRRGHQRHAGQRLHHRRVHGRDRWRTAGPHSAVRHEPARRLSPRLAGAHRPRPSAREDRPPCADGADAGEAALQFRVAGLRVRRPVSRAVQRRRVRSAAPLGVPPEGVQQRLPSARASALHRRDRSRP